MTADGIAVRRSPWPVDETVARFTALVHARGATLFAVIDHSGEAAKVGMQMNETRLLIFGNPRAGTPLMNAAPSLAIDLPLKVLVWEDDHQVAWMSCNTGDYLAGRHGPPLNGAGALSAAEALIDAIVSGG